MDHTRPEPDDKTIISQILNRNEEGLAALIRVHLPRVKAALEGRYRRVLDGEEVETVLQEVLWKLWAEPTAYDPGKGRLGPWLIRVADNAAKDLLKGAGRKQMRRALLKDPDDLALVPSSDGATSGAVPTPRQNEWLKVLMEVRQSLPPRQKEIIDADLAAGGQADSLRLAERLGIAKGAVQVARSKAWGRIREEFKRRGLIPAEGMIDERAQR